MRKLKNEPKSVQLWKHFSPWMLMLKVPKFKQRYLNSPKMEICENIWKYWGKVGGQFQKSWRGWLIKSRLVKKKTSQRDDFFCKMVIFSIPPLIPKKCVFCLKNIKISNIFTDIPKVPYLLVNVHFPIATFL